MTLEIFGILVLIGAFLGLISYLLNKYVSIKVAYIPFIVVTLVLIVLDIIILIRYDSSDYWGFLAILILSYPYGIIIIFLFIFWAILERVFPRR